MRVRLQCTYASGICKDTRDYSSPTEVDLIAFALVVLNEAIPIALISEKRQDIGFASLNSNDM